MALRFYWYIIYGFSKHKSKGIDNIKYILGNIIIPSHININNESGENIGI